MKFTNDEIRAMQLSTDWTSASGPGTPFERFREAESADGPEISDTMWARALGYQGWSDYLYKLQSDPDRVRERIMALRTIPTCGPEGYDPEKWEPHKRLPDVLERRPTYLEVTEQDVARSPAFVTPGGTRYQIIPTGGRFVLLYRSIGGRIGLAEQLPMYADRLAQYLNEERMVRAWEKPWRV